MILVLLESPFAAPTPEGIEANVAYARRAMRDCLMRGMEIGIERARREKRVIEYRWLDQDGM